MTRRKYNHRGSPSQPGGGRSRTKWGQPAGKNQGRRRPPIDDVDPALAAKLSEDFFDERGIPRLATPEHATVIATFLKEKFGPCSAALLVDGEGRVHGDWVLSSPGTLDDLLAELDNLVDVVRPGLELVLINAGKVPKGRAKVLAHDAAMVDLERRFSGAFAVRFWVIWQGDLIHLSGQSGGPGMPEADMEAARAAGAEVVDLRDASVGQSGADGSEAGWGTSGWNGPDAA